MFSISSPSTANDDFAIDYSTVAPHHFNPLLQVSVAMAAGLDRDRITVFATDARHSFTADSYCDNLTSIDTCYFLPVSNCSAGEEGLRSAHRCTVLGSQRLDWCR